ncbi:hypothetical protein FQA39_LY19273 [Lamprigera yunnana]|nr:hypothetical protein FQA39_LY19273 [Lamprigera yunnana]
MLRLSATSSCEPFLGIPGSTSTGLRPRSKPNQASRVLRYCLKQLQKPAALLLAFVLVRPAWARSGVARHGRICACVAQTQPRPGYPNPDAVMPQATARALAQLAPTGRHGSGRLRACIEWPAHWRGPAGVLITRLLANPQARAWGYASLPGLLSLSNAMDRRALRQPASAPWRLARGYSTCVTCWPTNQTGPCSAAAQAERLSKPPQPPMCVAPATTNECAMRHDNQITSKRTSPEPSQKHGHQHGHPEPGAKAELVDALVLDNAVKHRGLLGKVAFSEGAICSGDPGAGAEAGAPDQHRLRRCCSLGGAAGSGCCCAGHGTCRGAAIALVSGCALRRDFSRLMVLGRALQRVRWLADAAAFAGEAGKPGSPGLRAGGGRISGGRVKCFGTSAYLTGWRVLHFRV